MTKPHAVAPKKPQATMSVLDAIYSRRSVRAYKPDVVDRDTVRLLLDAAVHAPTAVREEPWAFAVVQDKALLRKLSNHVKESMRQLDMEMLHERGHDFVFPENVFYDAGTLIVIYGKPLGPFVTADCWLAAENLMLAARALDLGTCVIGLAASTLNTAAWKRELDVPFELTAFAPIIVGVPSGETPRVGRSRPEVRCWR